MGRSKNYLEDPVTRYAKKSAEVEVEDCYSGVIEFEAYHTIGKKGKAIIAVLLGTIIEWYDYMLYAYMGAVLSDHFFPTEDKAMGFVKYFLVFALGFITRPLGAYIFGSIGDSYGRKNALRLSIIGIALPTVLIGCLPSYASAGMVTVAMLCLCRVAQGLFIAAEDNGVDIFMYETLPKKFAGTFNSATWISASLGIGLASFVSGIVLSPDFPHWFWRLPFFLSGVLGLFALWFRKNLIESYDYTLYSALQGTAPKNPNPFSDYWSTLQENKKQIFLNMLIQGAAGGVYYFYFVFWSNYLNSALGVITASEACFKALFLTIFSSIVAPLCGYIADRIGIPKAVKMGALICMAMMGLNWIALYYLNTSPNLLMAVTAASIAFFHISINITMMRSFTTGKRYRCMSIGHAFGSVIFSSTTPAVAMFVWRYFKAPVAPLLYCCSLLLLGFVALFFIKTPDENLPVQEPEEDKIR